LNFIKRGVGFLLAVIALTAMLAGNVMAGKYVTLTLTYDYTNHKYNAEEVKLAINGKELTNLSMPPIIFNGYTLVPAREVFEGLGATVEWKKEISQVYINYNGRLVVLPTDATKAYVDGNGFNMAIPAKIINNKVMIPVRFVSEALGLQVDWDNSTRVVNISDSSSVVTTQATTIATTVETTTVATTTTAATTVETTTQATTIATTQATTVATTVAEQSTEVTTAKVVPAVTGTKDFGYDAQNGCIYIKNLGNVINVNDFVHTDDYRGLTYTLTLYGNYTSLVDTASYTVGNDYINKLLINSDASKTSIVFDEKVIMAADVYTDGDYIKIRPVTPKQKYKKVVVLDAGHGGSDPGANGNGLIEKDLTLAMLLKAEELFNQQGEVKCYVTRDSDFYPSFDNRTNLGNQVADAFVSIHINSAGSNTTASGTETYSLNANDQGNGLTSYMLAEKILNNLLANLGTVNRGVKSENWIVLRQSKIPATLIEIGFITNAGDAAIMGSADGQEKVAKSVVDAVTELFNTYPPVR
jgi:N-acetylmuramoyl-L-alanine amidase